MIRPEELQSFSDSSSVKPDVGNRLDGWLNELSLGNGQYDQFLPVSVICHGRDCHSLRHWRLSAQLRLTVWSSDDDKDAGRVKRHVGKKSAIPKKSSSSSSSSNKSNVTAKKRFAPQPKDILLGQHHGKKSGKPGDCSQKSKKCCPHSLKINFRQLPGFDWILEPSEIDIFMCKGDCHYAQFTAHGHHQHNPATNHALFQGYLHTINKRLVPKLCCTPSKLEAIQVVHYDQDNPAQLTTTKWEGAIVKECACAWIFSFLFPSLSWQFKSQFKFFYKKKKKYFKWLIVTIPKIRYLFCICIQKSLSGCVASPERVLYISCRREIPAKMHQLFFFSRWNKLKRLVVFLLFIVNLLITNLFQPMFFSLNAVQSDVHFKAENEALRRRGFVYKPMLLLFFCTQIFFYISLCSSHHKVFDTLPMIWCDVVPISLSLSFPPFEFESNGKELDHPVYISPNEMSSPLIYWFVNTDLSLLSTFFKYRNNCRFFTWIFLQIFWIALRVQYIYLLYIRMYVRE